MCHPFFIGLIVYIFYLPVFLFLLLFVARKKYKNYSFFSFWISNLGERQSHSYPIFVISLFIFGFLNLLFTKIFSELLPDIILSKIATSFLYLGNLAVILVIFYPMDIKLRIHERISGFLFIGVMGSVLFLIYPIYISDLFPNFLIVLGMVILFFSTLLTYSFIKLKTKYGSEAIKNLVEVRKIENSFVLRNATFWEWVSFISMVSLLFILSVSAALNILIS